MQNNGAYIAYAALLVAALSHFGFAISQNDAIQVISGIVAIVGVFLQHNKTNQIAAGLK